MLYILSISRIISFLSESTDAFYLDKRSDIDSSSSVEDTDWDEIARSLSVEDLKKLLEVKLGQNQQVTAEKRRLCRAKFFYNPVAGRCMPSLSVSYVPRWKGTSIFHITTTNRVDSKSPHTSGMMSWKLVILESPTRG